MTTPVLRRLMPSDLGARKGAGTLVCLTATTTLLASILDPHMDMLLVGDSLGMVVYGEASTLPVDLATMIRHGRAVVRGSTQACVVVDLPFGSYQESPEQAFRSAARVLAETGCQAVKLEGGREMAATIAFLVARGVPVMGHIGLTPQSVNTLGGFKSQGRGDAAAARLLADATAVESAGAFAVVLEGTVEPLARQITAHLGIPVIGIGASPACDGQVLVIEDLLGLTPTPRPRFAEAYVDLRQVIGDTAARFAAEVRGGHFPQERHCYT
jgi:3-methyl-2-oxobutanoate hydroxymethyltransferase